MDVLHLDTETHPVTQDDPAPPPICLQYCVSPEPEIRTGSTPIGTGVRSATTRVRTMGLRGPVLRVKGVL